jgi:hypothetical protein
VSTPTLSQALAQLAVVAEAAGVRSEAARREGAALAAALAEPACLDRFREILAATGRGQGFGNGRFARNVLESAIGRQAWRLRDVTTPTVEQLRELLAQDLTDDPAQNAPVEVTADSVTTGHAHEGGPR